MKKVLIAGGSGLIGKNITSLLLSYGYQVGILSRVKKEATNVTYHLWNLETQDIDLSVLSYDFIVNLTGAGIADKNWTDKRKKEIIQSRVKSVQLLKNTFKKGKKIQAIINASAIGYYGNSGNAILTEDHGVQNKEFLSEVCEIWEAAALSLQAITERLVILRIGIVLSSEGGALSKMVPPIRLGLANYLGSGKQWMSWVHIDDISKMILHFIKNNETSGIYNGVSPSPERNIDFTKQLKSVVNRFALVLPAPSLGIKTVLGEMARLVLNSNRISADKIISSGFVFKFPDLKSALEDLYKKR